MASWNNPEYSARLEANRKAKQQKNFEDYAKYIKAKINTNRNGNRYINVKGVNYFENGEMWDTSTGRKISGTMKYKVPSSFVPNNQSNIQKSNQQSKTPKFPGNRIEIGYGGNNQSVLGINPSNLAYGSVPEIPQVGRVNNTSGRTSFRDAFNRARNAGLSEFTWGGKRFNTRNKGEENYTWNANTKKWTDPLASVKQTATFTTDNIAPISVPRERVETPSFDYAANISDSLTNPNSNRYTLPRTATPTFVGQTNNNWLRDMFRDTFKTFNFG